MIPQLRPVQRERTQRQTSTADQVAGATARRIIRELRLKDETATWRQLREIVRGVIREPLAPTDG